MNIKERIAVAKDRKLKQLDLSNSAITELPMTIGDLDEVELLNLSKNNLRSLPDTIGNLRQLKVLHLSFNSLFYLPESFAQLQNLHSLYIDDNDFHELPEQVLALKNLKIINAEHNHICDVSAKIGNIENLEQLNLARNLLSTLPPTINGLTQLRYLDLKANLVDTLPIEISHLDKLSRFVITGNPILDAFPELHHNDVYKIGQYFARQAALKKIEVVKKNKSFILDLSESKLSVIPPEVFELSFLKILSLEHNRIPEIPKGITKLSNLEVLDISYNHLIKLPDFKKELPNLKVIETIGNPLNGATKSKSIEQPDVVIKRIKVAKKEHLSTLNLSNCGLKTIPEEVFQLKHLKKLVLGKKYSQKEDQRYKNHINTLPESIQQLTKLEILDLTDNAIKFLPKSMATLSTLKVLNVSKNQLTSFPSSISNITSLEELYLNDNKIATIPASIHQLSNLRKFNISNNILTNVTENIAKLSQLQTFGLNNNKLQYLPDSFEGLDCLDALYIQHNRLSTLPASFVLLKKLRVLNISNNNFSVFPRVLLAMSSPLKAINIANNQLQEIPELKSLDSLQMFYASDNQLSIFPNSLTSLPALQKIRLGNNKISEIPLRSLQIKTLQQIFLDNNPLDKDLIKAGKKGLKTLEAWFDKQSLNNRIEAAKLENATSLDISNLNLNTLPDAVLELTQLQTLILGKSYTEEEDRTKQNKITNLPKSITQLTNLHTLILSEIGLTALPNEINQLTNLTKIVANGNAINNLPNTLGDLKNIEYLDFRHNQIKKIPFSITKLPKLITLRIAFNPFDASYSEIITQDLRTLQQWLVEREVEARINTAKAKKYTELNLSDCQLKTIPKAVYTLQNVSTLNLANNNIQVVDTDIKQLQKLQHLIISNNQITELPESLTTLPKLNTIEINNNVLLSPPNKVVEAGISQLKEWFKVKAFNDHIHQILSQAHPTTSKKSKNCLLCYGEKQLNGYNKYLSMHFSAQKCFACNGEGTPQTSAKPLHDILLKSKIAQKTTQNQLEELLQQKETFEQSIVFQNNKNNTIQKGLLSIRNRYENRIQHLLTTYTYFEQVQKLAQNILYNQYLLKSSLGEFAKAETLEAGLSLNFKEKAAIQEEMIENISKLHLITENMQQNIDTTLYNNITKVTEQLLATQTTATAVEEVIE